MKQYDYLTIVAAIALFCAILAVTGCTQNSQVCHIEAGYIYCPDGSKTTVNPGEDGKDGRDGQPGSNGASGSPGLAGAAGPAGAQGAAGAQGSQGAQGNTGATGPAGPQGPQGPAGTSSITPSSGYVIQPACSSCDNMIVVAVDRQEQIGGTDYNDTWRNLRGICRHYGHKAPTTSANASGTAWDHSQHPFAPVTSDQWNPTYPWMVGSMPQGFPGGRLYMASGDPGWLSVATYPYVSQGDNLYTNQGSISWESYHPQSGGNWQQIYSATIQVGEYVLCAE